MELIGTDKLVVLICEQLYKLRDALTVRKMT